VNRIPPALAQPAPSTTPTRSPGRASAIISRRGRRRSHTLPALLGLVLLASLTFAPGAFAFFTPESGGSPNADQIDSLYKIILYIALVIFVAVEGALLYALFRFRARKGAAAAQIRGNTRLEVTWTIGAAVILVVLAVLTFAKLSSIQDPSNSNANGDQLVGASGVLYAGADRKLPPNGRSLNIQVNGQQYLWRYTYPGANNADGLGAPYSYEEMVVPTNTTVTLDIVSQDVVHSWWVPQLGGKFQAVPGYHNYAWFKVYKPGIYRGQCAALCGRGHARMIATVKAVPPARFDAWLANQKKLIAQANTAAQAARTKLSSQTGAGAVENP
jgi:cytochrome c oxidase subunit 2